MVALSQGHRTSNRSSFDQKIFERGDARRMRTEEGWRESSIEFAKVTNECFASNVMFTLESKCGLIGSEVRVHFSRAGYEILGVDKNQRAVFFGPEGDTSWSLKRLQSEIPVTKTLQQTIAEIAASWSTRAVIE